MSIYKLSKECFKFLESDFNFQLLGSKKETWGFEIKYINKTTGVKLVYEYRESCFFITLYKLTNNILIENPGSISYNSTLYGYNLDDIVNIRDSRALIKPGYKYPDTHKYHDHGKGALYYVSDVASSLRRYADDILQGNFELFSQLEQVVKSRINK